jgi:hypothetical protein
MWDSERGGEEVEPFSMVMGVTVAFWTGIVCSNRYTWRLKSLDRTFLSDEKHIREGDDEARAAQPLILYPAHAPSARARERARPCVELEYVPVSSIHTDKVAPFREHSKPLASVIRAGIDTVRRPT